MFISLPLRVTNAKEHWENKIDIFNYIFSFLGKTVKICLCNFHCCYIFSGRTSTVYFWDLLCHILVDHEDFDISWNFTSDKVLLKEPQNCVTPCPLKFSVIIFSPICPCFNEHLIFLTITIFYLLIFLYFGVFSNEKKLYEFGFFLCNIQHYWKKVVFCRKVTYELKNDLWYLRKTSDIQDKTAVMSL